MMLNEQRAAPKGRDSQRIQQEDFISLDIHKERRVFKAFEQILECSRFAGTAQVDAFGGELVALHQLAKGAAGMGIRFVGYDVFLPARHSRPNGVITFGRADVDEDIGPAGEEALEPEMEFPLVASGNLGASALQ